jgi:trimeric autotransporter adhesin
MNKRLNKLSFLATLAALCCGLIFVDQAIAANSAGAQQLIISGLRSTNHAGAFNAMARSSSGTLYLLMDQGDGIRVLEFDSTGVNVLAQAYLGAKGDIGYGLALDAAGNVFVTGTTSSGAIIGSNTAVFPNASSGNGNGFLAEFDSTLQLNFVSFLGGSVISPQAIAVNGNSVYITGIVFGSGLPVTPSAVIQNPPSGTTENGFVERFTSDGSQLIYATYLGGINGFTAPAAITADTSGNAYVGGYTEASGYPTVKALIAEMIPPEGATTGSGFLTQTVLLQLNVQ